tara:strand:- start:553 stop:894 length:342 start_codon:yes stop_codon:yes gene_type:complete
MAVSRKLTVKDKRMVGVILAIIFLLFFLRRFYPQGITQISNALGMNEDQFNDTTDNLSQIGEGFVLYKVLGSVLMKGWVKTVAVYGSLLYALDGVASLFNLDLPTRLGLNKNG